LKVISEKNIEILINKVASKIFVKVKSTMKLW
jgi:hypothetical protein